MAINMSVHGSNDPNEAATDAEIVEQDRVYVAYACAMHMGQVLEASLDLTILYLRTSDPDRDFILPDPSDMVTRLFDQNPDGTFNQPDSPLNEYDSHPTMGTLTYALFKETRLPHRLFSILKQAPQLRNHLAHGFLVDAGERWLTVEGRQSLVDECTGIQKLFTEAVNLIRECEGPLRERHEADRKSKITAATERQTDQEEIDWITKFFAAMAQRSANPPMP